MGLYETCFQKKMSYMLMKAHDRVEGYFIRIHAWKRIMAAYPMFETDIQIRAAKDFEVVWSHIDIVKQAEKKKVV